MSALLNPGSLRYCIFPIQDHEIWAFYQCAQASYWVASAVDLSNDTNDWENKLNDNERHFISYVLSFFGFADSLVNENLAIRFLNEVQLPEAKAFYAFQIAIETVHSEMYSLLLDCYIKDPAKRDLLFNGMTEIPCLKLKAAWCRKYIDDTTDYKSLSPKDKEIDFSVRLLGFACVELIQFSSSFCAIFWLKSRGLMPGLSLANRYVSKDEALHGLFACCLFKKLVYKCSQEKVYEVVKSAVLCEQNFSSDALPVSLIGMNCKLMSQYIEFVADYLVTEIGYPKIYNVQNPFSFMTLISLENKTNFFESHNDSYKLFNAMKSSSDVGNAMTFTTKADF